MLSWNAEWKTKSGQVSQSLTTQLWSLFETDTANHKKCPEHGMGTGLYPTTGVSKSTNIYKSLNISTLSCTTNDDTFDKCQ